MPPIGKTGSYATTTDIQDPLLGVLQNVEEQGFKYRAEQKIKDDAKAKKEDDNLKELEEYNKKFGVNIVGNQSIDDTTTQYAMNTKKKVGDLTRQIQQTTDYNKKAELMALRAKEVQSFDILKQIPTMINTQATEIAKGVTEGKYAPEDVTLIQEKLKALEKGKVHYYTDDYGNLKFTTYKLNENGDATNIIDKDQNLADLMKSITPSMSSKYDTNQGIAEQFVTTVKQDEDKIQEGFTTITKKGDMSGRIKRLADLKGREIAETPHEAKAMWKRMGNEPKESFNEEDKRKIAFYTSNDLQSRYGKTYEKDIDQAGILASQKEARAVKKEKEEETPIISDGTITVKEGEVPGTGVVIPRGSKTFAVKNVKKTLGTGKTESLKEVRLKPDGNLVYVVEETYEGETIKKTVPNQKGKDKLNKINPTTKKQYTVEELSYDEIEDVTTSNKKPTFKAYDSSERANDTDSFSILLMNPETGEYFKGTNDAKKYFAKKGEKLSTGKSKPAIQFDAEGNIIQ